MAEVSLYEQDLLRAASQDLPWHLLDGKNVLVTGATGLIGGAVADVLMAAPTSCRVFASGRNQQRAEKRFARYAQSDRFRFLPMDLTQPLEATPTSTSSSMRQAARLPVSTRKTLSA